MTSVLQPVSRSGDWHERSRGRAGMIGLIIAEGSLLAIFVVAYLFYIGKSLHGPYPKEVLEVPIVNTMCLLASSVSHRRAGGTRPASGRLGSGRHVVTTDSRAGRHLPRRHRASGAGSSSIRG